MLAVVSYLIAQNDSMDAAGFELGEDAETLRTSALPLYDYSGESSKSYHGACIAVLLPLPAFPPLPP